jgi:class 3 adenylate cyclase
MSRSRAELPRALILEGEPLARAALQEIFHRTGFLPVSVDDAASALRVLEQGPVDLCVVDVVLADFSGIRLIEEIRRRPGLRRVAVVGLSTRHEPQILLAAVGAGADDFVFKPASGEELVLRARLALERRRERSAFDVQGTLRRELTAVFCDVRGFTATARRLDPEWVVEVLNGLFERLVDDVERNGGEVDKLLGDGLLAFFGLSGGDPAERDLAAISAALAMIESAEDFSRESLVLDGRSLEVGVGVASGEVVVAAVGARRLRQVTAIGDAVNLASRLQGLAREGELLICERTFGRVGEQLVHAGGRPAEIKGIAGTPTIYPVIGIRPSGWLG